MPVQERAKRALERIHLDGAARELLQALRRALWLAKSPFVRNDRRIVEEYLSTHEIRKLHIGCGTNVLDGWLNTNFLPRSADVLHLDAVKPFPFSDETFDYLYTEHMIEHISYLQGVQMLSECFRVLKSKAKLRISTPDLSFLIDLYRAEKSGLQLEFIRHSSDRAIEYAPNYEDTFVINNYMRAWGHQFIYDEKVLRVALEHVGFAEVTRLDVGKSQERVFQNLENVSRKPEGMVALESFVLEAMKP